MTAGPGQADAGSRRLLLLAPSDGFGGGIERVASAVMDAWPGTTRRLDLYMKGRELRAAGSAGAQLRFGARAAALAPAWSPNIVLGMHVGLLPVVLGVARLTGARSGLFVYGTEVWGDIPPWQRALLHRCSTIISISSFSAHWLAVRAAMDPRRVPVCPLPIDATLAARAEQVTGTPRLPHLLSVSRIVKEHRYKGHFAVAESFVEVLRRRPDARWIVVGDGDDVNALRDRCEQLGILPAVELAGWVSDRELADLYASATALVLPSLADVDARPPTGEGFGLVYAEAGAFGVPSIASSASGGATDFVISGETGLTVPPNDPRALASAMLRLLNEPQLADRLGAAAQVKVREHHLPEHFASNLLRIIG